MDKSHLRPPVTPGFSLGLDEIKRQRALALTENAIEKLRSVALGLKPQEHRTVSTPG
jgi:hypothetical protein